MTKKNEQGQTARESSGALPEPRYAKVLTGARVTFHDQHQSYHHPEAHTWVESGSTSAEWGTNTAMVCYNFGSGFSARFVRQCNWQSIQKLRELSTHQAPSPGCSLKSQRKWQPSMAHQAPRQAQKSPKRMRCESSNMDKNGGCESTKQVNIGSMWVHVCSF